MKLIWKIVGIVALVLLVLGAALVVVSLFTGGGLESVRNNVSLTNHDIQLDGETPHSLQLRMDAGTLRVLPGDSLRVVASNVLDQGFVCELTEGVLRVQETWDDSWSDNLSRWMQLWRVEPEVTVYLPADMTLQLADVELRGGACEIDALTADSLRLLVQAGSLSANTLQVGQTTELTVQAGSAQLAALDTSTLSLRVAAGSADVRLAGTAEDYTAVLDAGAGSIRYAGYSYSMQGATVGSGAGKLAIHSSAGSATVDFAG